MFWLFQNFIPLVAAIIPPIALIFEEDFYGGLDQFATGAIGFIGVFLIFAVAFEVMPSSVTKKSRNCDVLFKSLIGIGTIFLVICCLVGTTYALGTLLPYHKKYMTQENKFVVNEEVAENKALKFSGIAGLVYISGVGVAYIYRRRAIKKKLIKL